MPRRSSRLPRPHPAPAIPSGCRSQVGFQLLPQYAPGLEQHLAHVAGGAAAKDARAYVKQAKAEGWLSFELLDAEIDKIIWRFANLFPGCLIKSMDSIRAKKKFFWDQSKLPNRHWLAANMGGEAFLGFGAFNTKKITGQDTIDFIKFRQNVADSRLWDEQMFTEVMGKPKE